MVGQWCPHLGIIKGLTFKTAGTYNTTNNRIDIFYKDGSKEAYRNGQKPYGRTQMGRDVRWSNNNTLTWKQKSRSTITTSCWVMRYLIETANTYWVKPWISRLTIWVIIILD